MPTTTIDLGDTVVTFDKADVVSFAAGYETPEALAAGKGCRVLLRLRDGAAASVSKKE